MGFSFSGRICNIRPLKFCFVSTLFKWKKNLTFTIVSYGNSYQLKTYKVAASSDRMFWLWYLNLSGKRVCCGIFVLSLDFCFCSWLCFAGTAGSHWHCHVLNGVAGISHHCQWVPGPHLHHLGSQQALLPDTAPRAQGSHLSTLYQWINGESQPPSTRLQWEQ